MEVHSDLVMDVLDHLEWYGSIVTGKHKKNVRFMVWLAVNIRRMSNHKSSYVNKTFPTKIMLIIAVFSLVVWIIKSL